MINYLDVMWKRTNSKLEILSKIRRFISERTAVRIYKTMIQPHLDYIDFVVDSRSSDRVQKLDRIKKKPYVELNNMIGRTQMYLWSNIILKSLGSDVREISYK